MKTPTFLLAVVLFAFGSPVIVHADPTPGPVQPITPVTATTVPPPLPAAFKKSTSPLFESNRDANEVGFEMSDLKKTFSATKFTGNMIAGGFGGSTVPGGTVNASSSKRGRMEQNPHNTVHVDIGGL